MPLMNPRIPWMQLRPSWAAALQWRGAHSINRRRREQGLRNCKAMMINGLRERERRIRGATQEEIRGWSDMHLPWERVVGRDPDDRFTTLVSRSIKDGWKRGIPPNRSLAWVAAQKNRSLQPAMVAHVFRQVTRPETAFEFFEWLGQQGFEHDSTTYALLLRSYCIGRRHEDALEMFKTQLEGTPLATELVYDVLIQGLFNASMADEAIELHSSMQWDPRAPRPTCSTNSIFAEGLCRNGRLSHALEFLISFLAKGGVQWDMPHSCAYRLLLIELCKARSMDDAARLFSRMDPWQREPGDYPLMIRGLCNAERSMEAKNMLWEYCRCVDGLESDVRLERDVFSTVALSLGNQGKYEDAVMVLQMMVNKWCSPPESLRKSISDMLWKDKRVSRQEATQVIKEICRPIDDARKWKSIQA